MCQSFVSLWNSSQVFTSWVFYKFKMQQTRGKFLTVVFVLSASPTWATDITFIDEDLLTLDGPIHERNVEAVEILHRFQTDFLNSGRRWGESCTLEHERRMELRRDEQNAEINQLSLPIDQHKLSRILNQTWTLMKTYTEFCQFHPFWRKPMMDLTCDYVDRICYVFVSNETRSDRSATLSYAVTERDSTTEFLRSSTTTTFTFTSSDGESTTAASTTSNTTIYTTTTTNQLPSTVSPKARLRRKKLINVKSCGWTHPKSHLIISLLIYVLVVL